MEKTKVDNFFLTRDKYAIVKEKPGIPMVLILYRIINALKFCLLPFMKEEDKGKPSSSRVIFNSLFYTCATLYEGLIYMDTSVGKHFKNSKEASEKIKIFNKESFDFRNNILKNIRNGIAYHNDENIISNTIKKLDFEKCIFLTTINFKFDEIYYPFADEVALNSLLGTNLRETEELPFVKKIIDDAFLFTKKYIELAEFLITEKLNEYNVVLDHEQIHSDV